MKRLNILIRKSADQVRTAALKESQHSRQPAWMNTDVGIQKDQYDVGSKACKCEARKLLATPARRQLWRKFQSHSPVVSHLLHNLARSIFGVIVENNQLQLDISAGQDRFDSCTNRPFFVAGR